MGGDEEGSGDEEGGDEDPPDKDIVEAYLGALTDEYVNESEGAVGAWLGTFESSGLPIPAYLDVETTENEVRDADDSEAAIAGIRAVMMTYFE